MSIMINIREEHHESCGGIPAQRVAGEGAECRMCVSAPMFVRDLMSPAATGVTL
jgi:hypothetical protein